VSVDVSAPFPWFGGKRTVAADIWARFGNVSNYVEPFFGSGAMLLARPHKPKTETVNDADHMLCNFWRAVQAKPDEVAHHADWPVNEADLAGRHYWLITEGRERVAKCEGDPAYYDTHVAGWWLWGACAWIGGGWCSGEGPWVWDGKEWQGINRQLPHLSAGQGINRQLPHLSAGQGINRKLPHLSAGRGINRKLPHLGDAGQGIYILDWMERIASRIRNVRVACGDWSRVCGDSVTWGHGLTGVFLDPPYGVEDRAKTYTHDCRDVAAKARDWAIAAGKRPDMRIAFAGYDGEHDFPADWSTFRWKANGGYGSQGDGQGRQNARRETLWFSPACVAAEQSDLFAERLPRLD
jgi:DNA adenine methylase